MQRHARDDSDGSRPNLALRSVAIVALAGIAPIHQEIDEGLRLR
jgi:hypothetical protein